MYESQGCQDVIVLSGEIEDLWKIVNIYICEKLTVKIDKIVLFCACKWNNLRVGM